MSKNSGNRDPDDAGSQRAGSDEAITANVDCDVNYRGGRLGCGSGIRGVVTSDMTPYLDRAP